MTDRQPNSDKIQPVGRRLPIGHSFIPQSLALMFAFTCAGYGFESAHGQSNVVKESDALLDDILRRRGPSKAQPKSQQDAAPRSTKGDRERRGAKAPSRSAGGFVGTWRMDAKCPTGNYVITLNITAASKTTVAGTSISTSGFNTIILDGSVSGNNIRFRRQSSNIPVKVTDTVHGRLTGASAMTGTIAGGVQPSSCNFTATR